LKILLIATARELGGAELYVERLIAPLEGQHQFTVAISHHTNMLPLRQRLGKLATVIEFDFDRIASLIKAAPQLRQLARQHDVVHLNSNHPASRLGILLGFALSGCGKPVVCVEHRVSPVNDIIVPNAIAPFLPTLFRWSRRGVARLVAVSKDNAQALTALYGIPPNKVEVVYPGVDVRVNPDAPKSSFTLRSELNLRPEQPVLLVLARIMANKGHRFLIEAAPRILSEFPDAHFVFAGAPDEVAPLHALIEQLNLGGQFSFPGFRSDIPNLLGSSDMLVLPSLAEGFSVTLVEALAAGLPIVATRVGGAAEIIVDGETGYLVPPADAPALAEAVLRALRLNEGERQAMRTKARALAQEFTTQVMGQKMAALYARLIA
jgi:glycosyltransferase involved in cell wall biosynthesis